MKALSSRPGFDGLGELIHLVRGHKVMLDRDLASLYGVSTGVFNRAVKRHRNRFPSDFMFQLSSREWSDLKCQSGISSWGGDRRAVPHAFTEQGVAMLSSVLNSERAVQVNIAIMRAFVRLRAVLAGRKGLARQLEVIERRLTTHDARLDDHAEQIRAVLDSTLRLLKAPELLKFRSLGVVYVA